MKRGQGVEVGCRSDWAGLKRAQLDFVNADARAGVPWNAHSRN
jgi:hypothetical protein